MRAPQHLKIWYSLGNSTFRYLRCQRKNNHKALTTQIEAAKKPLVSILPIKEKCMASIPQAN